MNTLGQRIRHARADAAIKRKDLAKQAGIAYSTLADIENDNIKTCTAIAQLASALRVTPLWLATGAGKMRESGEPVEPGPDYVAIPRVMLRIEA